MRDHAAIAAFGAILEATNMRRALKYTLQSVDGFASASHFPRYRFGLETWSLLCWGQKKQRNEVNGLFMQIFDIE